MTQQPPYQGYSRRASPAFAIGGIGYEPLPTNPSTGYNQVPFAGWVCFHCGDRFVTAKAASQHFGKTPQETPECLM